MDMPKNRGGTGPDIERALSEDRWEEKSSAIRDSILTLR